MNDYDYLVKVVQGKMATSFGFIELCDAMKFAETCLECGEKGTQIFISEVNDRGEGVF